MRLPYEEKHGIAVEGGLELVDNEVDERKQFVLLYILMASYG